jgi:hypothetical protein
MVKYSKAGISVPFYLSTAEISPNKLDDSNNNDDSNKRARPTASGGPEHCGKKSSEDSTKLAPRVSSVPALSCLPLGNSLPLKKRMKRSESSAFLLQEEPLRGKGKVHSVTSPYSDVKPEEHFRNLLRRLGQSADTVNIDPDSFLPTAKQQHASYPRAAMAARNEDLDLLRSLHNEGQNLQCANQFGESVIHIVCRRSRDDILEFLVSEVGVSLRLMDDLGRTPLHDAAWTDKPNFKLAALLLTREPDLIHARDKRGNSPLAYVPKQNWGLWNAFLEQNKDLFVRLQQDGVTTVG